MKHPPDSAPISLMFSGGVDSTAAAMVLAERHERVHLLTFANGFGHYGFGRTERRVVELKTRYGARIVSHLRAIRPLVEALSVSTLMDDYRRFGSGFVWCLGCKLAMHVASTQYDLAHGIAQHTDGSSGDTSEMVEQMPAALALIRRFYEDHGIAFGPTGYEVPRAEKQARLRAAGFRMGLPIRDRALGIQPSCIPGELYYLPFLLLGRRPVHPEHEVTAYIQAKRPLMDRLVRAGLPGEGA
ncbi:MAG: hypothetical protein ABIO70_19800 [Pseudomonadota bacterium]